MSHTPFPAMKYKSTLIRSLMGVRALRLSHFLRLPSKLYCYANKAYLKATPLITSSSDLVSNIHISLTLGSSHLPHAYLDIH